MSIILTFIIWWVGALWLGFLLLLLFDTSSVVNTASGVSANVADKVYYSGYVLSTMGNGDFKPGSSTWQVIISIFSFSGFIFITTAITYLISVSSAVIHKRSLSLFINDLVSLNSKEDTLHCFLDNATELRNMINRHNQNHLAYPVVHYFFSMNKKTSFSQGLWKLNHLLGEVKHKQQNQSHKIIPLFQAIDHYLDTVTQSFIPTPQKDEIEEKHAHRKSQLQDLLKSDGWNDPPKID